MTAIRDRIFAAVVAALQAVGVVVEEMPSGDPDQFPCLAIFDRGQRVLQDEGEPASNLYAMGLLIEGYVEGSGGVAVRSAINALYVDTIKALVADETFGGLAQGFAEGDLTIDVAELASVRAVGFVLDVQIQFFASRIDPAVL